MAGLKFLRQVVGLIWIGVFIWAVVSLFRADWAGLVIAVVLWFVLGLIFSSLHSALQRSEVGEAQSLLSNIAFAVEGNEWTLALTYSTRLVGVLRASAYRDKTAAGKGNGQEMVGPYGVSLVGHAFLLGAVGRLAEAQLALNEGLPLLTAFGERVPEMARIIRLARELQGSHPSSSDFELAARTFHSFA